MLKISQKTQPSSAAVIIPLKGKLGQLYDARVSLISNMNGYPSAIHVIGILQRQLDTSSYQGLLNSIKKIRDLVKITADVIDSMEGVKVDKFQINRTEIAAYVENVTANLNSFKPSPEDVDLISHLITSYEANTGAWLLQGSEKTNDLHLNFKGLYESVLKSDDGYDLPVYAPHLDEIATLGTLPQFASKIKKAGSKENVLSKDTSAESAQTLYKLAATRIIDHVYQLLMDREIWYSFISPRAKAEIASNLERSKSLKVFSLYLQSLLSYNQFFMLETFMKGYDLVQDWITYFPPLEASTTHRLDNIVRPHDILNAKEDVDQLFRSFSGSGTQSLAKKLIIFPNELVSSFGITDAIRRINDASIAFSITADFKDAGDLDDKKYMPLLSGIATADFNISHDLAKVILIGKMVSGEIDKALADLVPALVRGSSKSTIETLKGLSLKAKLSFVIPHALQWHITKGVHKSIEGGKLSLDSAAPQFSWAYHEHIRKNFKLKMATDDQIVKSYPLFQDNQIVDRDKAAEYRELIGYNWKSLVPDHWQSGASVYTEAMLKSDPTVARLLIESLSGKNFEIAIRELGVEHLRKIWATYLSSFALLYIDDTVTNSKKRNAGDPYQLPLLVEGHGKPYGTNYNSLANKQKAITQESDFVMLAEGVYLRILNVVPVVVDDLSIDAHFFAEHPTMYFASNSQNTEVKQWVLDESLLHLCCVPVSQVPQVPPTMFTNKYAYLTAELFMNMDLYFKPAIAEEAREVIDIGLTVKDWPYDKSGYFLKYKTFGSYGADISNIEVAEETELVADAINKIEKAIDKDYKEVTTSVEKAGSTTEMVNKNVIKEVEDAKSKISPLGDDEKSADLSGVK